MKQYKIMEAFEALKEEFKNNGFTIDGEMFVKEQISYSSMSINGRIFQQPRKNIFKMKYISDGTIADEDDSSDVTPLFQFDVLDENEEVIVTLCITCYDDFNALMR